MTAEHRPHTEPRPKTGLIDRVRGLTNSLRESQTLPKMSREELLKGIGVFEDPQTLQVMTYVQRDLSISSWGIFMERALDKSRKFDPSFNEAAIEDRLTTLFDNGFVNKQEPDNPGAFTLYSPTAKGVRVMKALNSI